MTHATPSPCSNPGEEALHNLIAGALEHLACHLQSGRPRSAMLSAMLLDRLARDTQISAALSQHARHLCEVLESKLLDHPGLGTTSMAGTMRLVDTPAARALPRASDLPRPQPWLTWERIEEVA